MWLLIATVTVYALTSFFKTAYGARLFYRVPRRLRPLVPSAAALGVAAAYALVTGVSWPVFLGLCVAGPLAAYFYDVQDGVLGWFQARKDLAKILQISNAIQPIAPAPPTETVEETA